MRKYKGQRQRPSPKGFIYARDATGKGRKIIRIYKLRTIPDLPGGGRDHLLSLSGLIDPEEAKHITPFRSFLRKSGLDEIPQLWNIFVKRDMQLLGVRPFMVEEFELLPHDLKIKLISEKPGLIPAEAKYDYQVGDLESRLKAIRLYFNEDPRGIRRVSHSVKALFKRVAIYSKR
ncbi:MAG: sugar transferase [Candidatus Dojkabacteria bacterium]|nr:MAG: sugar transferase [Candidatus Dojkabacteria bacterium]